MIYCDEKKRYTREEVGGKALGLFSLLRMGKNVPAFFVVPTGTDISSPVFYQELLASAERLGCERFAVRSSSVAEDAENNSFAGQYDTLLNVAKKDLLSAVQKVLCSKDGARTKVYAHRLDEERTTEMAVVVQKQVTPTRAGVAFSTSPFDSEQGLVESFSGQGESLVSGEITPERFYFSKKETPINSIESEVFRASQDLERAMSMPVDVEWAYNKELYFLQMRPLTVLPVAVGAITGRWQEYVYRDFAFFNQCVQAEGTLKSIQEKVFGFHIPVFEGLLVDGHEFYSETNDKKTVSVWKRLDKKDFFERFIQKVYHLVKRTKARVCALQKIETKWLDDQALLRLYKREIKAYLESYLPLMMRPDDYLQDTLSARLGKGETDELLFAVTYPVKATYYAQEKYDFLQAYIAFHRGDATAMDKYVTKYEWINAPLGKSFTPLTVADVRVRMNELALSESEKRLSSLKRERRKNLALRRSAVAKMNVSKDKRLALLLAEFTHLRTYTTENSDRYFYYIKKKLLVEMARRKNVAIETLLYCTPKEVEEIFLGIKNPKCMQRRKSGVTFAFSKNAYTVHEGSGLALLKKLLPAPSGEELLKGSVACAGRVQAKVKIITKVSDIDKLQKGEILVTKMTTPELVRAMERASGIITDEGGITCHASIIAREYAMPCLVGTGTATALLKDGMEVELDCIHGTCRIIKKN